MQRETIIEPDRRFVTIKAYCDMTGLSYATVDHMCKSGQLNYITTESGKRRIDTKTFTQDDVNRIIGERLGNWH